MVEETVELAFFWGYTTKDGQQVQPAKREIPVRSSEKMNS